jgi:hypothetical protein
MPEVSSSRIVPCVQADVWEFIADMGNWGPFIMGYQQHVVVDDVRSEWTVRGEVGPLARTVRLEVRITEWTEPEQVRFEITGLTETFDGSGEFRLAPASPADPADVLAGSPGDSAASSSPSWWQRLRRWLRRERPAAPAVAVPSTGGPASEFAFELELRARGMTAPVVNAMLGPLMNKAADEFADRLVAEVVGGRADA